MFATNTARVRTGTPCPTLRDAVEFVASVSPVLYTGCLIEIGDGAEHWRDHQVEMLVAELATIKLSDQSPK